MEAMGIIFSNIYDNNMGELTRERTSASIPFGSRYRQIDFALQHGKLQDQQHRHCHKI